MISPDPFEEHRKYAQALFGEEFPYPIVPDVSLDIARRYGLLSEKEHPHGGFYYLSLSILDREGVITHKVLPWKAGRQVDEYQRLFASIGGEPGEWTAMCGLKKDNDGEFRPAAHAASNQE